MRFTSNTSVRDTSWGWEIENEVAMKCCGVEVDTPFCSSCGKQIMAHGANSLYSYLKGNAERHKAHVESIEVRLKTKTEPKDINHINHWERRLREVTSAYNKWNNWAAIVKRLIKEKTTNALAEKR